MSTSPVPTLLSSTFTHRTLMLTSVLRPMTASEDTNTRACYQQQFHDALPLRSEGESQNTHDAGPAHTYHVEPAISVECYCCGGREPLAEHEHIVRCVPAVPVIALALY